MQVPDVHSEVTAQRREDKARHGTLVAALRAAEDLARSGDEGAGEGGGGGGDGAAAGEAIAEPPNDPVAIARNDLDEFARRITCIIASEAQLDVIAHIANKAIDATAMFTPEARRARSRANRVPRLEPKGEMGAQLTQYLAWVPKMAMYIACVAGPDAAKLAFGILGRYQRRDGRFATTLKSYIGAAASTKIPLENYDKLDTTIHYILIDAIRAKELKAMIKEAPGGQAAAHQLRHTFFRKTQRARVALARVLHSLAQKRGEHVLKWSSRVHECAIACRAIGVDARDTQLIDIIASGLTPEYHHLKDQIETNPNFIDELYRSENAAAGPILGRIRPSAFGSTFDRPPYFIVDENALTIREQQDFHQPPQPLFQVFITYIREYCERTERYASRHGLSASGRADEEEPSSLTQGLTAAAANVVHLNERQPYPDRRGQQQMGRRPTSGPKGGCYQCEGDHYARNFKSGVCDEPCPHCNRHQAHLDHYCDRRQHAAAIIDEGEEQITGITQIDPEYYFQDDDERMERMWSGAHNQWCEFCDDLDGEIRSCDFCKVSFHEDRRR